MANALKQKKEKNTGGNVLVIGKFASDAVADSTVSGGTQSASMYYNTTTNKLKVKEGSTWKTITTS